MNDTNKYNHEEAQQAIYEITLALHKHYVPISCIDSIFRIVKDEIESNTIAYNPKRDNITDDAKLNTMEKEWISWEKKQSTKWNPKKKEF